MKCAARIRIVAAVWFAGTLLLGAEAQAGLTCVPFARSISEVKIEGDAWTWWGAAAGRYSRGLSPAPGAVLVMKRTDRLRYGHVAVISAVLNSREVLLDHANWSPGEIARGERAIDVSANNDWSQVRVWHDASASYGVNVYPAYGFVHPVAPRGRTAPGRELVKTMAKSVAARPMLPGFKPRRTASTEASAPRAKPRRIGT